MRWPFLFTTPDALLLANHRLRRRRLRRRPSWRVPFTILTLLLSGAASRATSVIPPTFGELVAESDLIARGSVVDVSSRWVDGAQGRVIKTFVTFAVESNLKGNSPPTVTLEFLGGIVGADSLQVSGMPRFTAGAGELLFIRGNGVQFCPLVRFGHGRYRLKTDAVSHRRFVARNDDRPLESVADVQSPDDEHRGTQVATRAGRALSVEEFELEVAKEVARQQR